MNLTYKLINFLDSQYTGEGSNNEISFSTKEKVELYELAYKNKIGLFFLERLREIGELSPLEDNYQIDSERFTQTSKTAVLLSSIISKDTDKFAVFKFLKPYPHTPSDVDVLFFLSKEEYFKTVDYLLNNGYFKIGESPSQVVVYDLRGGLEQMDRRTNGGKKGGKYYIDLYNDVSASYVIYINKETLTDYIIKVDSQEGPIQALHPIAELPVVLTHSIIPEQLFTLADYYTTLYYIKRMNKSELEKLAQIFIDNNATIAGNVSLNVISNLHEKVYGFVPDKVTYLMESIGWDLKNNGMITSEDLVLPYRYNPSTIIKVLLERMKNKTGLKSILTQCIKTLNPRLMKWVIYNIMFRRTRESY